MASRQHTMSLSECHKVLGVAEGANLDEVKRAYRQQAFRLHPDLNPDDHQAALKFQRLSEAYVCVSRYLEAGGRTTPSGSSGGAARPGAARGAQQAYQRQARAAADAEARRNARQAGAGATASGTGPGSNAGPTASGQGPVGFTYREEEVLGDILKDPFARKVFEDIYAQLRRGRPADLSRLPKRKRLDLRWGDKTITLDLSRGLWGSFKGWLRGQLDVTHTVHLSPLQLLPGKKVRIKLTDGWRGKERAVEVNLPHDYVVGRAIRLKGLGRRLGPFKGDLYLRMQMKA